MTTFKDIMQKYYDDEKLGIKKEDAPVNATGVAVAGTGDDSSTVVVKKKKKNPYDGRTKEAKAFLKRMTERQAKLKEAVELDEFNKMTVTMNDPKQRKKVFDDLKKQKRLDVSMGPGKTIKVDGKGKALNLFAKDIMNFYDAEIRAEEIEEDAKMAKQSDDNLKSLMKKFRDMEKKDPKMPSTQFMIKRIGKEMKKRGLKEQDMSNMCCKQCGDMFGKPTAESSCQYDAYDPNGKNWVAKNEYYESAEYFSEAKKSKEFHLFDNEKEAQAFAKKSGGKLVKGVNKSKGKFAVVIGEVKTSFIDDIKEKMSTYSSDLMLNESNLKIVQDIVKRKSAKNIKFKDGSLKVDMFTASALSQIYDKVNTDNKKKMEKMMNGTKDQFMKLAKFALSKVG